MKIEPGVVAEIIQSNVEANLGALVEVIRPGPAGWWVCKTLTVTRGHKHVEGRPKKPVLIAIGAIINVPEVQMVYRRKGEK